MRKIILLLIISILSIPWVFAIQEPTYGVYDTREAFDASGEGGVCKTVTDGCSEFTVIDGKVGDPIKACKVTADFKFAWTCLEGADNIYYFWGGGNEPSTTDAGATVYPTAEAFLAAEGNICQTATDGCNMIGIENGQLGPSTLMACMDENGEFTQKWSCKAYITTPDEPIVGGDADAHGCIGSAGYVWNAAQESCMRPWENGLWANDASFYGTIKEQLTWVQKYQIVSIFQKYKERVMVKDPETRAIINQKVIERLDQKISDFLLQYPQDIGLPYKADMRFKKLILLKFEMMIWQKTLNDAVISFNQMNYVCEGNKSYTIYRGNYCIDDMCFPVADDEMHATDGQFLLANYITKREVSASGEKFVGTDTETQEEVTFWFKNEDLTVWRGETVEAECSAAYE